MAKHKRQFSTANDSRNIQTLCAEAELHGISVEVLWKILCVTNADPDLIAFPTNCANLIAMIRLMGTEWKIDPAEDPFCSDALSELQREWLPVRNVSTSLRQYLSEFSVEDHHSTARLAAG